jgi:hypothetical protein
LPLAEFARNNSVNATTGVTPFYANYGFHPRFDPHVPDTVGMSPAGHDKAADLTQVHEYLRRNMKRSQERMAKYYNEGRIIPPEFNVGDKVFLKSKNIRTLRPSHKLDSKHFGPFKIIEKVSDWAYRLELPKTMKIHDVFHVDLLEPWKDVKRIKRPKKQQPKEVVETAEEETYEIEEVLATDWVKKGPRSKPHLECLFKWKGYEGQPNAETWEIYEGGIDDLLDEYYSKNAMAAGSPKEPEEMKGVTRGLKKAFKTIR